MDDVRTDFAEFQMAGSAEEGAIAEIAEPVGFDEWWRDVVLRLDQQSVRRRAADVVGQRDRAEGAFLALLEFTYFSVEHQSGQDAFQLGEPSALVAPASLRIESETRPVDVAFRRPRRAPVGRGLVEIEPEPALAIRPDELRDRALP